MFKFLQIACAMDTYFKNIQAILIFLKLLLRIATEILWNDFFFHELLMRRNIFYFMFQSNQFERNMK